MVDSVLLSCILLIRKEHDASKISKKKYDPTTNENKLRIASSAYNSASSFYNVLKSNASRHKNQQREDVRYTIDVLKENINMAVAILMMFMIGAPLGAIIKKGGLGVPVLFQYSSLLSIIS